MLTGWSAPLVFSFLPARSEPLGTLVIQLLLAYSLRTPWMTPWVESLGGPVGARAARLDLRLSAGGVPGFML